MSCEITGSEQCISNIRINQLFTNILVFLFLIFSFFPFLRILPLDLDAQPNALMTGSLICIFMGNRYMKKDYILLLSMLIIATFLLILDKVNGIALRVYTNYVSLFVISYATYISLRRLGGLPYGLFRITVIIWLAVGMVQLYINPNFLSFLTLRGAEGTLGFGRGVSSLAAEPTFYGMVVIILMMINYINFNKERHFRQLNFFLLIQLIWLSRSTTCILFSIIALVLFVVISILKKRNGFKIIFSTVLVGIIAVIIARYLVENTDSRLSGVLKVMFDNPEAFLVMDYSVNHRFNHAFFPIMGFFDSFGIPHGLGHFNDYLSSLNSDPAYSGLLTSNYYEQYKITTSLAGALFELGVFALPLFYIILTSLKAIKRFKINIVLVGCGLFSIMINAMNFNQAILPFFIGNLIYLKYNDPQGFSNNTCIQC